MKRILSLSFLFLLAVGVFVLHESRAHALSNLNGPTSCNHFSPDYDPLQCFFDGGGVRPISTGGGGGGGTPHPTAPCGGRSAVCHTCSGSACVAACTGNTGCSVSDNICKTVSISCLTGA